uniref:Uncharacterized protein n=1 Tax=Lotharella globosa TaxID=91324 RepID=A0A7S3ZD45_9EUKA|mmetsp:Transcript_21170/g.42591  ORF Transcript_21170/g.42591 Transcript_21170/m.42591 type:complete len:372 (-) Transcript_21170:87-1202(-)
MKKSQCELGVGPQHNIRNRSLWNNWKDSHRGGGTAPSQKHFGSDVSLAIRSTRIRGGTTNSVHRSKKKSQPSYSTKLQPGSRLTSEPLCLRVHANVPAMGWTMPKGSAGPNKVPALVSRRSKIRQSSLDAHTSSRVQSSREDRRHPRRPSAPSAIMRPSAPPHRPLRLEGFEWLLENTNALVHQRQNHHHHHLPKKPETSRPESRVDRRADPLDFKLTSRASANAKSVPRPSAPNSAASRSRRCWRRVWSPRNVSEIPSSSDEESSPQEAPTSFGRFQERGLSNTSIDTDNVGKTASISQLRGRHVRPPSRQKPPPQALHLDLQTFKLSLESEDTPKISRGVPSNKTSRNYKHLSRRHHGHPKIAFSEMKD